jgi:hypothetical protein
MYDVDGMFVWRALLMVEEPWQTAHVSCSQGRPRKWLDEPPIVTEIKD